MKRDAPTWLIARLGDDFNWWVEQTSQEELNTPGETHGVLDPRQVLHLLVTLEGYTRFGLDRARLAAAFHTYALETELDDNQVRLTAVDEPLSDSATQLFALPSETFDDFLDALTATHIAKLNTTHHYATACTADEMFVELDTLDNDRYFNSETLHPFDQINEILQWSPAEWDDS